MLSANQLYKYFRPSAKTHVISKYCEEAFRLARQPSNNMVIWEREADERISGFIELLYEATFTPLNILVEKGMANESLKHHLAAYLPLNADGLDALITDISLLTEKFLELCDEQQLRLHLRTVKDDACEKFHVDGYPMRLICTYDGPGTEWLPNDKVNRKALGTTNERIVAHPDYIRQMQPFAVGIMKGDNLTHSAKNGTVHRSPSIKDKGLKRFVLRMDT